MNRGRLKVSYFLCLKLDFRNNHGNKRRQGERVAASQPRRPLNGKYESGVYAENCTFSGKRLLNDDMRTIVSVSQLIRGPQPESPRLLGKCLISTFSLQFFAASSAYMVEYMFGYRDRIPRLCLYTAFPYTYWNYRDSPTILHVGIMPRCRNADSLQILTLFSPKPQAYLLSIGIEGTLAKQAFQVMSAKSFASHLATCGLRLLPYLRP